MAFLNTVGDAVLKKQPETQPGLKGGKIVNMPEYRRAVFSKARAVLKIRIYRGCKM